MRSARCSSGTGSSSTTAAAVAVSAGSGKENHIQGTHKSIAHRFLILVQVIQGCYVCWTSWHQDCLQDRSDIHATCQNLQLKFSCYKIKYAIIFLLASAGVPYELPAAMALLHQQGITQQTLADTPTAKHPTDTGLSKQQLTSVLQQLQQLQQQHTARAGKHHRQFSSSSRSAQHSPLAWAVSCSPEIARFTTLQHMFQQHVLSNSPAKTLAAALTEDASSSIADALAELLAHARTPLLATAKAQQLLLPGASHPAESLPAQAPLAQAAAKGACKPDKARQQQQQQAQGAVWAAVRPVRSCCCRQWRLRSEWWCLASCCRRCCSLATLKTGAQGQ
jgi:hypothetical protein